MFQYDDRELAKSLLEKAIDFMDKQALAPTPMTYSVVYACVAKRNMDLLNDVNERFKEGKKLDADYMEELFNRYFINPADLNSDFVEPLNVMMTDVMRNMDKHTEANQAYVRDIEGISNDFNNAEDSSDSVASVSSRLTRVTQKTIAENKTLSGELKNATEEIEKLKTNLKETEKESNTDILTTLLNRRGFYRAIDEIPDETVLSCLVIDIDFFKKFNDTYGHFIGDRVLERVAKEIKNNVRGRDLCCRFGGEEFVVLLVDTPSFGAKNVAEVIRKAVANLSLVQKSSKAPLPEVNVSIGVASTEDNTKEGIDEFFKRGDNALYFAKAEGRNQSVYSKLSGNDEIFEPIKN